MKAKTIRLVEANESTIGTPESRKYKMEYFSREYMEKSFHFVGHVSPRAGIYNVITTNEGIFLQEYDVETVGRFKLSAVHMQFIDFIEDFQA